MKRHTFLFPVFIVCLLLIVGLAGVGFVTKTSGLPGVESLFSPMQKGLLGIFSKTSSSDIEKLKQENASLLKQVAHMHVVEADNKALRDQFQTTTPAPENLLPAAVIGMPGFLPGVSVPDSLIIGMGSADGVSVGQPVVYKDNLLGTIVKTNAHFSEVRLLTNTSVSFAAKTAQTGALGIIKGEGDGQLLLDNVVLSDTLIVNDVVVSSPDVSGSGTGFPPGLIIGKITSVDKKPSNLFQKANIAVLVDITKLSQVFILIKQ